MSEYTFKNLNEIDNVAEPADGTTVMGFENGTPIQMPMRAIKGSGGIFIIDKNDPEYSETDPAYGDKIKEAIEIGRTVVLKEILDASGLNFDESYGMTGEAVAYDMIIGACVAEGTAGWYLYLDTFVGITSLFRITSGWDGD